MFTLAEVVESYRNYLLHHQATNPKQFALKRFDERLASCPEAARAEAATFEYLRHRNLEPRLLEDATTGGNDFECHHGDYYFAVEVTAMQDDTVSDRSGIDNEDFGAGFVDLPAVIAMVRSRLSSKGSQATKYHGPRVLVIASTHIGASTLFSVGAEEFLTGESKIVVPIGPEGATGDSYMATELKNAAHLRASSTGEVEPFRKKYALVLLIAIHGTGCHVVGLVHPEPEKALPISVFPRVPFARIKWPIVANSVEVECVVSDPQPEQHHFFKIQMTTEELREGVK